jgi:hypothetical protein
MNRSCKSLLRASEHFKLAILRRIRPLKGQYASNAHPVGIATESARACDVLSDYGALPRTPHSP